MGFRKRTGSLIISTAALIGSSNMLRELAAPMREREQAPYWLKPGISVRV